MVSINFVNHLNLGALNFSSAFLKTFWRDSAFNEKSENINSNDFRMIFALSQNVFMRRSYVIVQQYFKKFCKNYVMFERYD